MGNYYCEGEDIATKDVSQLTTTKNPGTALNDTKQAINRYKELCEFDYELTDTTQQINLFGKDSKGIRLTYKIKDSSDSYNAIRYKEITDTWLIDLATTTINETTFIGGILDGSTPDFGSDYLVWAFFDDTEAIFRGFGATRRPSVVYSTTTAVTGIAGDKGSETRFNLSGVANDNGLYFVIGSEVQIYNGITSTAAYNHGIVTGTDALYVDVLLDNSTQYGSANIPSTPGQMFQNTQLKPLLADGTLYGTYSQYVCNLQISDILDILNVRRRGDKMFFTDTKFILDITYIAGTVTTITPALQFLPKHSSRGYIRIAVYAGTGSFSIGPEDGKAAYLRQDSQLNDRVLSQDVVTYNKYTKNWLATKTGVVSFRCQVVMHGYDGETEF